MTAELIETASPWQINKHPMVREAFTDGKWAAYEGKPADACPFNGRSQKKRRAWLDGHRLQSIGMKASTELSRIVEGKTDGE